MDTAFLYSLIPNPIYIKNDCFSGELFIDGNVTKNQILFRFRFDNEEQVAPVMIQVDVLEESYQYCCYIRDFGNAIMKTTIFTPEFALIEDHIVLVKVGPIISHLSKEAPR